MAFSPGEEEDVLRKLELCLQEVRLWMSQNLLKLNDEKTDFIILGSQHNLKKASTSHITIGNAQIQPAASGKT